MEKIRNNIIKQKNECDKVSFLLLLPIALRPFQFGLGFLMLSEKFNFSGVGLLAPRPTLSYPAGPMIFCRGCLP
jgi:hypothetical protein